MTQPKLLKNETRDDYFDRRRREIRAEKKQDFEIELNDMGLKTKDMYLDIVIIDPDDYKNKLEHNHERINDITRIAEEYGFERLPSGSTLSYRWDVTNTSRLKLFKIIEKEYEQFALNDK